MLAILLPRSPSIGRDVLIVVAALALIWGLYYMIVTPGWQPGNPRSLRYPYSLMVFIVIALVIALLTVMHIFSG
jgi:predicted secreted protein